MNQDKYIGQLLDNRYEILDVLGVGGMAVVYKARCHRLNRMVAIKILKDEFSQDEDFRRRFHAESQAVAMLSHPNIVSVYDVSSSEDSDYIVMELIDGITLKYYMEKKGVLNWKETLHFAMQIAKALEHAHSRGIVHRDIKPHNVMVLKNGSVKVADFGIAQVMSTNNTMTQEALGSVHYISPEQAKGSRVDSRSDVYSLGIVMYEMISGRVPYDGDTPLSVVMKHINGGAQLPTTLNPNTPKALEQIIMKAMAHQPNDRYATATAMLYDMDEFRKDPTMVLPEGVSVEPPAPPKEPKPKQEQPPKTIAQRKVQPVKRAPEPNSRVATIAIASCAVVGLVAIIILLLLLPSCQGSNNQITVPNLVGQYFSALQQYSDIQIEQQGSEHSSLYPAGQIIYQSPEAGNQVEKGSKVFVIVSLGPKVTLMEDVSGMELKEARAYLNGLGLGLKILPKPEKSTEIPEGCVIRTEPEVGQTLERGQTVTVYYSMIQSAAVPDVAGKTEEEAKAELEDAGFTKLRVVEVESDLPAGTVVELSVEPGSLISTTKEIIIYVSKVKPLLEDLTGKSMDEVTQYLEGLKLNLEVEYLQENSDTVADGCVVRTEPVAGEPLSYGQKLTIYYSAGDGMVVIPDLRGQTPDAVRAALESLGITDIREKEISSVLTQGTVVMLSVDAGAQVEIDKQIVVYISKGDLGLEDLAGMSIEDAAEVLKSMNLRLQVSLKAVEGGTEGMVIRTEPAAGSTLDYGQEITLIYGMGANSAIVPDVEGDTLEVAKQKLRNAGFTNLIVEEVSSDRPAGQVLELSVQDGQSLDVNTPIVIRVSMGQAQSDSITYAFAIPHDAPVVVKIVCDGVTVVDNRTLSAEEQTLILSLTGSGTKRYDIYVDDVFYRTETVDFNQDE